MKMGRGKKLGFQHEELHELAQGFLNKYFDIRSSRGFFGIPGNFAHTFRARMPRVCVGGDFLFILPVIWGLEMFFNIGLSGTRHILRGGKKCSPLRQPVGRMARSVCTQV